MKNIIKIVFNFVILALLFTACHKVADLTVANNGSPVTLLSSATDIAPVPADSLKTVLTLSWTSPNYATDATNYKYIIEIDSTGRNFSKENTRVLTGIANPNLTTSFTARELNAILLGYGFSFGVANTMDVRITSSYGNNNERLQSNVLKIKMTAYKTPPKVVPPSSKTLFLVGNATAGGWGNPVPLPAQQFTKLDSVTYQGTFYLNGGAQYVFLPVNGDWTHKFNVADAGVAGLSAGGNFGADLGDANIPGPAKTGMYTIKIDFQRGVFTVTQVSLYGILYVPGDYQSPAPNWTPATAPTLGSPKSDGNYDGYVNIPAGGTYQFKLTTTPDWNNALGDGGGGTLVPGGPNNLSVPVPGYYHIVANTTANTWSATATTWSIMGSFPASNWSNDIDMVYSVTNNNWTTTITTVAGDQFKFRANHDWGLNYGETGGKGGLAAGGDNIGDASKNFAVPAGTHTITLYLNNTGYYTYNIQ